MLACSYQDFLCGLLTAIPGLKMFTEQVQGLCGLRHACTRGPRQNIFSLLSKSSHTLMAGRQSRLQNSPAHSGDQTLHQKLKSKQKAALPLGSQSNSPCPDTNSS